ncbi:MAG TPA: orotidine-5'-phosphate decarboxylase [Actinomycetota bacterium]|nr:orotidine-5'-phosphate decarboxylase [Actinomycetota bacterium]
MNQPAPIALALDTTDLATACAWAGAVDGVFSHIKVGLETYLRDGAPGVALIREAAPRCALFLDLKIHDIPNTMAGAARSVAALEPDVLTVHAAAGSAGIHAVAEALPDTRVAAVTVLTSLAAADLAQLGISGTPGEVVERWAGLAVAAGARAIVSSAQEVRGLRTLLGEQPLLITPGIRPAGAERGDQQRVVTPADAITDGAGLLVVGRPVTGADDPGEAALAIAGETRAALSRLR